MSRTRPFCIPISCGARPLFALTRHVFSEVMPGPQQKSHDLAEDPGPDGDTKDLAEDPGPDGDTKDLTGSPGLRERAAPAATGSENGPRGFPRRGPIFSLHRVTCTTILLSRSIRGRSEAPEAPRGARGAARRREASLRSQSADHAPPGTWRRADRQLRVRTRLATTRLPAGTSQSPQ